MESKEATPPPVRFQPVFPYHSDPKLAWAGPSIESAPPMSPTRRHRRHSYAYEPGTEPGDEPEQETDVPQTSARLRVLSATILSWLVVLGSTCFMLWRATYSSSNGIADGAYRYAVAQSLIWILIASAVAVVAAGALTGLGLLIRLNASRVWGNVHVSVMFVLTVAHLVCQYAPATWLKGAQDTPIIAFFAPDPTAGRTFLSKPGLPERLAQLTTQLRQFCSTSMYPSPPDGSDLAKFRWFCKNHVEDSAMSERDRRYFQGGWADGLDFQDPLWYQDNAKLDKFIERLGMMKERARAERNFCQEILRTLPGRLEALHFSRAKEGEMDGHVARYLSKHLDVFRSIWQGTIGVLDTIIESAKEQHTQNLHHNETNSPDEGYQLLAKLKGVTEGMLAQFINEGESLPRDLGEVEAALSDGQIPPPDTSIPSAPATSTQG